jgi:hypothetical protein
MKETQHRAYVATYLRGPDEEWPHDLGDDPEFRTSESGGPVTWGVCRRPLRNAVNPGDTVVFFAADHTSRLKISPIRYVFVGWATVEKKFSQADIWTRPELKKFRHYRNLLIRPHRGGFEHYEPAFPENPHAHKDWLRRVADTRGFPEDDTWPIEQRNFINSRTRIRNTPFRCMRNYVVFAPEGKGTTLLANPPLIAEVRINGHHETWSHNELAKELKGILSIGSRRTLRTRSLHRSHPHIRLDTPAEEIREKLENLCHRHRLRRRRSHGDRDPVHRDQILIADLTWGAGAGANKGCG